MSIVTASAGPFHSVFVYGSLMEDEVLRLLLRRIPSSAAAVLHGFRRFSIKGRVYPAIIPLQSNKVPGKVLLGITDNELDVLDQFEAEYERRTVEVFLKNNSRNLLAFAYVWGNKEDENLYGEWDFEEWKRLQFKDYIQMVAEFADELHRP